MTGKQRVLCALTHQEADRVPRYDSFWEDTIISFKQQGLEDLVTASPAVLPLKGTERIIGNPLNDFFGFDIDMFNLDNSMRWPSSLDSEDDETMIITDRCGYQVKKIKDKSRTMELLHHVNPDLESWEENRHLFTFNPKDTSRIDSKSFFLRIGDEISWNDAETVMDAYRKRENFILVNGYGPFEGTWRHHGYEQLLMNLALNPALVSEMFEAITNLTIEVLSHAVHHGMKPDGYWMVEDLGSTRTTLMSPKTYREVIWPFHKKLGDFLHREGIYYFIHSCGNIESLIPLFIDAGVDALQPLQANTGMDAAALKKTYGKRITFWGNIDERMLTGDPFEIEREISSKVVPAMQGGGYIYHSDHSIPPTVSLENYRFMIQMLDKYGTY